MRSSLKLHWLGGSMQRFSAQRGGRRGGGCGWWCFWVISGVRWVSLNVPKLSDSSPETPETTIRSGFDHNLFCVSLLFLLLLFVLVSEWSEVSSLRSWQGGKVYSSRCRNYLSGYLPVPHRPAFNIHQRPKREDLSSSVSVVESRKESRHTRIKLIQERN